MVNIVNISVMGSGTPPSSLANRNASSAPLSFMTSEIRRSHSDTFFKHDFKLFRSFSRLMTPFP